jgi:hypothetical protein
MHLKQAHGIWSSALVLAFASCLIGGCASMDEIRAADGYKTGGVEKSEWLDTMQEEMVTSLCSEDEFYRSCFRLSESECRQRAHEVVATCENLYGSSLPATLTDLQGERWGSRIGACTGDKLYQAIESNYPYEESERCQKLISEM